MISVYSGLMILVSVAHVSSFSFLFFKFCKNYKKVLLDTSEQFPTELFSAITKIKTTVSGLSGVLVFVRRELRIVFNIVIDGLLPAGLVVGLGLLIKIFELYVFGRAF